MAARPSGTEPKVKFYMFTYKAPGEVKDLAAVKSEMADRLAELAADLQAIADTV